MTTRRLPALLAASLLAAMACMAPSADRPGFEPTIRARNAAEAPLLPRFADALPDADPESFGRLLAQLRGTPVLVNIWGSWCPPCTEEMPRIVAAHEEFGDRVQFVGIDIEDSRTDARAFIDDFSMTFPSVFDPPDAIKASLGQFGQPVTIFYEADGTFLRSWTGPIGEDLLWRSLRAISR